MPDLTDRLLSENFEEALGELHNPKSPYAIPFFYQCSAQTLAVVIRELHARLRTARDEGAAEALRSLASGWHHHSGHETLPEAYPRPCQIGCTKCFILAEAKLYDDRAAAIRKGLAKEGK